MEHSSRADAIYAAAGVAVLTLIVDELGLEPWMKPLAAAGIAYAFYTARTERPLKDSRQEPPQQQEQPRVIIDGMLVPRAEAKPISDL